MEPILVVRAIKYSPRAINYSVIVAVIIVVVVVKVAVKVVVVIVVVGSSK